MIPQKPPSISVNLRHDCDITVKIAHKGACLPSCSGKSQPPLVQLCLKELACCLEKLELSLYTCIMKVAGSKITCFGDASCCTAVLLGDHNSVYCMLPLFLESV